VIVWIVLISVGAPLQGNFPFFPENYKRRWLNDFDYEMVGQLGDLFIRRSPRETPEQVIDSFWDKVRNEQDAQQKALEKEGWLRIGGVKPASVPERLELFADLSATNTVDPTPNPGGSAQGAAAMAFSGSGRNAFVANDVSNTVSAFAVDLETGDLTQAAGSPYAVGEFPKAIGVDPTGRFLYVGGDFGTAAFRIDGLTSQLTPIATYPFPVSFPDSLAVANHFVFAKAFDFNTSHSTIQVLRIDPSSGALTPTESTGYTASTFGPMAITKEGDFLYVGESSKITGYAVSSAGTLTPLSDVNFPAQGPIMAMAVHPNRPYLYVSNFGSPQDTLQVYGFDYLSGSLAAVGSPIPEDSDTEGMAIHPTGGALYTASPNTRMLSSFAIDHSTGLLTNLGTPVALTDGGGSLAVQFAPASSIAPVGGSYSETIDLRAAIPPVTFSVTKGALPDGLSLDPHTGTIAGTSGSAGESSFEVQARDHTGGLAYQTYAIQTISPAPLPAAPSGLTATPASSREVRLSWQDNAQRLGAFRAEASLDGGDFVEVDSFPPGVTTAVVPGFSPGSKYSLRLKAVNSGGSSEYSNTAEVTTPSEDATPCVASDLVGCLAGGRFEIQALFWNPTGKIGAAHVVPLTSDTAYLWFFSESNVEAVVKVLNGCGISGHFWVFAGGLTNVAVVIRIFDTETGATRDFINRTGTAFVPIQDTGAFGTCGASPASEDPAQEASFTPPPLSEEAASWRLPSASASCTPGDTAMCLDGARFRVEASYLTKDGRNGPAHMVQVTPDTGYMWFFSNTNVEAVVKVLSACGVNEHHWVFAGGLTDVDVQLTVTDTVTGAVKPYHNPQSTPFQPIQDTSAFDCP